MATPVNMPQIGQDLETGKIIEWHVQEGDKVNKGDIVATVESDKASFEVEVSESGIILKLLFTAGDEAEVFKPIAYIGEPGEKLSDDLAKSEIQGKIADASDHKQASENIIARAGEKAVHHQKLFASPSARRIAAENNLALDAIPPSGPNNRIIKRDVLRMLEEGSVHGLKATPVARKIANMEGVGLDKLQGSGPGGKIQKEDVLGSMELKTGGAAFPRSAALKPAVDDEVAYFDKSRKRIAERLTYSKQTIPHYYLFSEVDVTGPMNWKSKVLEEVGIKLSFNDILIRSVAQVLRDFPLLNAHVDDEKIILKSQINIGVAVSVENGLLVPVIPEADTKSVNEINFLSKKNADDARKGIINPGVVGSFTVSNLGMFGINMFQAIINPPESAILSVGVIEKKVIPSDDGIRFAPMVTLGLAVDHRAADGAYAAKFMKALKENLEFFEQ
jgi:pyruvate dehydrogenase E2 component (dihydrolipoamide acetyltransferase)